MDAAVRADVIAVHIGHAAGVDHGVVQRSVQLDPIVLIAPLDAHPGQGLGPGRPCLLPHGVEVPVWDVVLQVRLRPLDTHERDAALHNNRLTCGRRELREETKMPAPGLALAVHDLRCCNGLLVGVRRHVGVPALPVPRDVGTPDAVPLEWLAELTVEVNRVVDVAVAIPPAASFRRALHPTADRVLVHDLDELLGRGPPDPTRQVDLDPRLSVLGEGEADDACARRGRELRPDAIVGKAHSIVSGLCDFRVMRETGTVSAFRAVGRSSVGPELANGWHHQEVAEIAVPAHAAHVREAEPLDRGVLVGVPGAVVAPGDGVGAQLDQTERRRGSRKGLAEAVGVPRAFRISHGPDDRADIARALLAVTSHRS